MLDVKTFIVNPLEVNCYIISDETKEAVIIDPGMFAESEWSDVKEYVDGHGLCVKHCLFTHTHFDHVMACHYVEKEWGLRPEGHADDVDQYKDLRRHVAMFLGFSMDVPSQPPFRNCVNEGSTITFGTHTIEVIHTPGHSRGSVCYYIKNEKALFAGDTLFAGSCGRTDLTGGNYTQMMHSLQRLTLLPADTIVYTGHGPSTTIKKETRWIQATYRK